MRFPLPGRRVAASLAAAALMLTVAACADESPAAEGDDLTQIVVLTPDQATNVVRDYAYTAGTDNQDVTNNLHAQLIRNPYVDEDGSNAQIQDYYSFEPYLAESYDVSDDGLTYTFHLRQGLLSQQGNELTSEDVIWSFERKFNTPGGGMKGYYSPMLTDLDQQMKAVDRYTVTITVPRASDGLTLLGNLANNIGSIYDSTYLKAHATDDDPYAVQWGVEDMLRGNFGFGPYELKSVTPGEEIVMTANPNYVFGEPAIKTIIRRVVADAATRANMLKAGDADVALALRPVDQEDLASDDSFFVPTTSSNLYLAMPLNTKVAPFDDKRVRQAMAYAMPYEQIVENVFHDRAYEYTHLLDDTAPNYDGTDLPDYTFDPDRARELLSEAGYPDGIEFTLSVNSAIPTIKDAAIQFQSAAKQAGITVNIEQLPAAQLFQDGLDGKLQASLSQGAAVTMSPSYELSLLTQEGGGSNSAFWEDSDADRFQELLADGLAAGEVTGAKASQYWDEAEDLMMDSVPYVFIARVRSAVAMTSALTGFTQRTDYRIDYGELKPA